RRPAAGEARGQGRRRRWADSVQHAVEIVPPADGVDGGGLGDGEAGAVLGGGEGPLDAGGALGAVPVEGEPFGLLDQGDLAAALLAVLEAADQLAALARVE